MVIVKSITMVSEIVVRVVLMEVGTVAAKLGLVLLAVVVVVVAAAVQIVVVLVVVVVQKRRKAVGRRQPLHSAHLH